MSIHMMMETHAGQNFSAEECRGWLRNAGFRETRLEHLNAPASMIIGIK